MDIISKVFKCHFDGSCGPQNPGGEMGMGAVVMCEGEEIFKHSSKISSGKENSCNAAEYLALIKILEFLIDTDKTNEKIIIKGDSMLVVQQMNGVWRIKEGIYRTHALKAKELLKKFSDLKISWVPREENTICDKLSK